MPFRLLALFLTAAAVASTADAAGLLWKFPEDGTSATYRGEYKQLVRRTDATQQDVTLSWARTLTVRVVGTEQAEYMGKPVAARWLEIEQATGELIGGAVQAGPGGRTIVKLLVPESALSGATTDEDGVPQSFIPIIKGWRQIDDRPVEELPAKAYDPSPEMTLLGFPNDLQPSGETPVQIAGQNADGTTWKGERTTESKWKRAVTKTELTRSDAAPFGSVGWTVEVETFEKQSTQGRGEFETVTDASETMQLVEVTDGATALLAVP